jgi:hypothetical protein
MDWKTVVIAVLVTSAILLGGVVVSGLRPEGAAYGQGGVYATYLAATAAVQDNYVHYVILDSESRRMLFYRVDIAKFTMEPVPASGFELTKEFKRPSTAP